MIRQVYWVVQDLSLRYHHPDMYERMGFLNYGNSISVPKQQPSLGPS